MDLSRHAILELCAGGYVVVALVVFAFISEHTERLRDAALVAFGWPVIAVVIAISALVVDLPRWILQRSRGRRSDPVDDTARTFDDA